MPIRVIHGNGDLIGAVGTGISQGVQNFQEGQKAQADIARAEQIATNLQAELEMDQETHAQGVKLFNERMLQTEARQAYLKRSQLLGPDEFDQEREVLDQYKDQMSPEDYQFGLQDIELRRELGARQMVAGAKREKLRDMATKYPDALPEIAQAFAEDSMLSAVADDELQGVLQDAERSVATFQDRQLDLQAWTQLGAYTNAILTDPNGNFELQEMLPGFLRSIGAEDNPRAAARFVGALAGQVSLGALMQDPAAMSMASALADEKRRQAFAQTPEGRAALAGQAGPGGALETTAPQKAPRNFAEQLAAQQQRHVEFASGVKQLESSLEADGWRYQSKTKKRDTLRKFRDDIASNPQAFEDEAAYMKLMQKHGIDPTDPQAMEAAANASTMLDADFAAYQGSLEDGRPARKDDAAKLEAFKRAGPSAPDLYALVEEAARDETGEKWKALPPGADEFKRFFRDPTKARKAESPLDTLAGPKMR